MHQRLPLRRVYSRTITDKAGKDTKVMDIPFHLLIQRMFDCPLVMERIFRQLRWERRDCEGASTERGTRSTLNASSHSACRWSRGKLHERRDFAPVFAYGSRVCHCRGCKWGASHGRRYSIMIKLSTDPTEQAAPCRLAGLYWQEHYPHSRQGMQLAAGGGAFRGSADLRGGAKQFCMLPDEKRD